MATLIEQVRRTFGGGDRWVVDKPEFIRLARSTGMKPGEVADLIVKSLADGELVREGGKFRLTMKGRVGLCELEMEKVARRMGVGVADLGGRLAEEVAGKWGFANADEVKKIQQQIRLEEHR